MRSAASTLRVAFSAAKAVHRVALSGMALIAQASSQARALKAGSSCSRMVRRRGAATDPTGTSPERDSVAPCRELVGDRL